MTKRAAIVLAGGKSERFQNPQEEWQDKALIKLCGKPLLIHAVENAREVVEEIVVCVNDQTRKSRYHELLTMNGLEDVMVLMDEQIDHLSGPMAGILTGLMHTTSDYCFTLPADMPLMQPKVIDYLLNAARDTNVVVPMWSNGRLETLTMALKRPEALEIARTLCQLKRPRSDDIIRGALNVMLISIVSEIRNLDPDLKSFININYKTDLTNLQPRQGKGQIKKTLRLNSGALPFSDLQNLQNAATLSNQGKFSEASEHFSSSASHLEIEQTDFWAALSRENEGKSLLSRSKQLSNPEFAVAQALEGRNALLKASENYGMEAKAYGKADAVFLAERATSDKMWCVSRANEQPQMFLEWRRRRRRT
jgi:molybdopterin-guanine dinucleotide biosynthesis protein A